MSYPPQRWTEPSGVASAWLRPAAQGPDLVTPTVAASALATQARGADLGVFRWTMTAVPSGPAPHFHRTISESFYVLSGTVRLFDGRDWLDATAGDYLYVPPGGVHAFRNESGEPADMLIIFAPAAPREEYFAALEALRRSGRDLSPQEWEAFYAEHDQYPA